MIHTNLSQLKTLNDVRLVLPAIYSEASCKVYTAAFNKVTRLTGKPLTHVPADPNAWYLFAQTIVWAGSFGGQTPGDQKRAFDTWVKKIAAGIVAQHVFSVDCKSAGAVPCDASGAARYRCGKQSHCRVSGRQNRQSAEFRFGVQQADTEPEPTSSYLRSVALRADRCLTCLARRTA